jgi:membrane protease YdiL (CAAX protease family)
MIDTVSNLISSPIKRTLLMMLAAGVAVAVAYGAGEISHLLSFWISEAGAPGFFREPINLALGLAGLLVWQKLSRLPDQTPPLWGSPAIGLGWGWLVGCALPGLALLSLIISHAGVFEVRPFALAALIIPIPFILIHAMAEEVVVRGIAQRAGHAAFGPLVGVGLAALTFCALQTIQGYSSFWHIANSALFGAALGFIALGRGGIWAAIAGHAGWTWLETSWIGDAVTFQKAGGFWAGAGPDSYGSPVFTLVLILVATLMVTGQALQAAKEKQ